MRVIFMISLLAVRSICPMADDSTPSGLVNAGQALQTVAHVRSWQILLQKSKIWPRERVHAPIRDASPQGRRNAALTSYSAIAIIEPNSKLPNKQIVVLAIVVRNGA